MPEADKEAILSLLLRWQAGELAAEDVHSEAEAMFEAEDWPELPETDARSIVLEVLTQLDVLNQQLITEADIPAILDFLATGECDEMNGWAKWRAYWESINMDERRRHLKDNPFYCV